MRLTAARPHLDFSMQEVAESAGVSLRTVYNHFDSREALLDGLVDHVNELFEERGGLLIREVDSYDQLGTGVAANFPIFEELAPVLGVADRLDQPESPMTADHDQRTDRMVELVAEELPDLTPQVAGLVGRLVRHLVSQRTWRALVADYGMSTPEAVASVQWAMDTLVDAARRGEVDRLECDR